MLLFLFIKFIYVSSIHGTLIDFTRICSESVMSKEAWELAKGECEGTMLVDGNVKLNKVKVKWRQEEPTLVTSLGIEDAVRYVAESMCLLFVHVQ